MKKSLIALAAMAATGMAFAQSSVTLFGIVDATLARGTGSLSNKNQLTNSGYNSSRLGFRGTEDLGGGMSASFWLEMGMNNDDGSGSATNTNNQTTGGALGTGTKGSLGGGQGLTFNRRSTVSLAGGWGELRMGRDYTPQFLNLTTFDPFGTNGVGESVVFDFDKGFPTGVRASNSVAYFLPGNLGGFYGTAMGYLGENAGNAGATAHDGRGWGARFGWAGGPVNVALALSNTDYAATAGSPASGKIKQNNVGAQWDFRVLKLQGEYSFDKVGDVNQKGFLVGGLIPVGAGEIRLSYSEYKYASAATSSSDNAKADKFALGYVHNLSKRTAVYATAAHAKNNSASSYALSGSTTAAGKSSNGYDLGLRHSF